MLDGDYRRLELRDSREGRVQLSAGAFGVELVAATCLEALQRDVERVLLILGVTARDLESILRTAQIEVGDGQLRGQQHLEILRSEEHTSELQSHSDLVCRLLLEKKKNTRTKKDVSIL